MLGGGGVEGVVRVARLVARVLVWGGGAVEAARLVPRVVVRRGGAADLVREETTEAARFAAGEGAAKVARLVALFFGGGATEAASSSSEARLRLIGPVVTVEAARAPETLRVTARLLDGGGAAVVGTSSSATARFRLLLLGPATSSKITRGLRVR